MSTVPGLVITLTSSSGVPVSSITSGTPATVKATLKDATGTAIAGAVVTFSTDTTLATISPAATALTDASGVATVTLNSATLTATGATTITATSQVGTTALTGTIGYSVGGAIVTVTNPVLGASSIPAYGTTSVAVTVSVGGVPVSTPQPVTFSSPCASSGKAVLSTGVSTANGVATATYRDNGCAGTDIITASVSGLASSSATLTITVPSLTIALTSGGVPVSSITSGTPATVKATLKDATGTAIAGAVVTFSTDTTLATISPAATALTDASGVATVTLNSATLTSTGATTITATSQVGTTALTGTIGYSVGGAIVTVTNPVLGASSIPAYGTTSVAVTVSVGGVPVTTPLPVTFSSTCASSGKAVLSTGVSTVNGVATASYRDNGCAGMDIITASVSGLASSSATLTITVPSLTIALTSGGVPVSSITSGTPATVKATLKDATGAAVAGEVVTFSTDTTLATISPAATALTDASGVATVTLNSATLTSTGATTITATSQVGTTALTGTIGYSVGGALVTITNPAFVLNPLTAFATTSFTVTVSSGGIPVTTPQTVTFSSACASSGKAVLSASVVTVNGVATGSYRDNGCAGTDTVTASVSGLASSSATLNVTAPTTGSIQYVSSVPINISLKGTGGTVTAQVTFKVLDSNGNPISGKTVSFGLSTTIGGITLTPGGTATSDANGLVVTSVNAGTVSTPVRVTASTCSTPTTPCTGTTLTTQSSQLTITTGIPDQFGFSLSVTKWNIEGWNVDGVTTVLTARLTDHFRNPVPDGTAIVFTAEAGSIVGTCSTVGGACSSTYTSSGTRPLNGRVTVLAYAVGEETFTDLNGNGTVDSASEMIDANGLSTDIGDAYVDYNEDGKYESATEPFYDFSGAPSFVGTTSGLPPFNFVGATSSGAVPLQYHGVLCTTPGVGICSPQKSIYVRQSQVIVLSSSTANITINGNTPISLPQCNPMTGAGAPSTFTVTVVDQHGNAMPAGTTVAFAKDNGTITSPASYIVPNSIGCRTGYAGCPASAGSATFGDIPVTMQSDATFAVGTAPAPNTCTNTSTSGTFTVTVTTPSNSAAPATTVTTATATVTD